MKIDDRKREKKVRRDFIKKVAYTVPKLIILGSLSRPKKVRADATGGPPPPPGDGWDP